MTLSTRDTGPPAHDEGEPLRHGFDFASIPVHAPRGDGCDVELDDRHAAAVGEAISGPGRPLEPAVRREMEPMLGHDLSRLRVHQTAPAQRSANDLGARAYSVGKHIVFGAGEYAPHTLAGRRLLAHELWHIHDGRAAGPARVRRQPLGGQVQAPTPLDQKEMVRESITFLRGAADYYTFRSPPMKPGQEPAGARVYLERLGTQLDGYLKTRDTAANLIDTALAGDAALTAQLQAAYRDAVTALLNAASLESRRRNAATAAGTPTGDSPFELFTKHQKVIHEWAWPRATPDPRANELLDKVSQNDRGQIKVGDTVYTLTNVDGFFHPNAVAVPPPANTTVSVAPGGTDRIRAGLARVGAMLATTANPPMPINTTTTVRLDLGRYGGGDRALYRFTYVRQGPPRGNEILVERLGSIGPDQRPPSEQATPEQVFTRAGFVRAAGVPAKSMDWPDAQFALLQSAVAQIPESILGPQRGLMFIRVAGVNPGDPTKAANYDQEEHAIRVYDNAFGNLGQTKATPGGRASSDFDRLIAHEIGHALDFESQRPLNNKFKASIREQDRFHPTPIPNQPGRVTLPPGEIAAWRALHAKIARDEAALSASRSLSGRRYERDSNKKLVETNQVPAGEVNEFQAAVAADGPTPITNYAGTTVVEHFAEAFALYISEPQTLARLRPHVYAYFSKKFPDPARP
ncbi:hypothetical protein Rhe02_18580 [Rhizocola hellebori]|uniref:eCIS core domain-containing protein n=1 Tax=Rhizocola hellebori TaxID=1392758 RepID=A0A8J3VF06_9ACTN|nr:hypothetical protein Rhe02_18580 [Rhizocola hellebori]